MAWRIVIDIDDFPDQGGGTGYDLQGVLTHEIAHAATWEGHLSDQDCLGDDRPAMCAIASPGDLSWRTLHELDRSTLRNAIEAAGG